MMMIDSKVILLAVAAAALVSVAEGDCIWYGHCGTNPEYPDGFFGGKPLNRYDNTSNEGYVPADEETVQLMYQLCDPAFVETLWVKDDPAHPNGTFKACCDKSQLKEGLGSLAQAEQLLARCPSCYENFRRSICEFTCSPKISDYLNPTVIPDNGGATEDYCDAVLNVEYYISEYFTNATFESCKEVKLPSLGIPALNLMCGSWGADCNPQRWYDFLGSASNGFAPYDVFYHFETETEVTVTDIDGQKKTYFPLQLEATPCYVPYDNASSACSCTDCLDVCEAPVIEVESEIFKVGQMDGVLFVMILVAAVGSAVLLPVLCICCKEEKMMAGQQEDMHQNGGLTRNGSIKKVKKSVSRSHTILEKFSLLTMAGVRLELGIQRAFTRWGTFAARHPLVVIAASIIVCIGLSVGIIWLKVMFDPIELWNSPTSQTRKEKEFFDSTFRPFYRPCQIIVKAKNVPLEIPYTDNKTGEEYFFGPAFNETFMLELLDLQRDIEGIVSGGQYNVSLKQVCNKPLDPEDDSCNIQNIWAYWQDDEANFLTEGQEYLSHALKCFSNPSYTNPLDLGPATQDCLGKNGVPVQPYYVLGGFIPEDVDGFPEDPEYEKSTAVLLQVILDNYDSLSDDPDVQRDIEIVMEWEEALIDFLKERQKDPEKSRYMDIAFYTERSTTDEVTRGSESDILTIAVSYLVMFVYVAIALGKFTKVSRVLIESKITLGLGGVVIVILSVVASVGCFGYMDIESTLIIFQILPFLILAIGVDNMFILVQTYQRSEREKSETAEEQLGRVVGEVAPAMLLSAVSQFTCLFIGLMATVPAVNTFALNAGLAVVINFFMQITCFVGLFALDVRRHENNRYDIICCLANPESVPGDAESILVKFFRSFYAPALLNKYVRPLVIVSFFVVFCFSIAGAPQLRVGLDEELSVPDDSYLIKYFDYMQKYLSVGPPFYVVLNNTGKGGFDLAVPELRHRICGSANCNDDSLQAQIYLWSIQSNISAVSTMAQSWIDDYESWMGSCCQYNATDYTVCQSNYNDCNGPFDVFCNRECEKCSTRGLNLSATELFNPAEFQENIAWFLDDSPGESCATAGKAAYRDAVRFNPLELDQYEEGGNFEQVQVGGPRSPPQDGDPFMQYQVNASNFMTFHTILHKSEQYIEALKRARQLTDDLSETINKDITDPDKQAIVFPYCYTYVYYESYLTVWEETLVQLAISIAAIFLVMLILTGLDVASTLIMTLVIVMVLADMFGLMYIWNIQLNGISQINLVVSVGIAVEFCSHVTKAFTMAIAESKIERVRITLVKMGSVVLSGCTLTNVAGITVLAFAQSQLFEVFFFRMYLGITLICAAHGLIFLPVLLSYIGPGLTRAKALRQVDSTDL